MWLVARRSPPHDLEDGPGGAVRRILAQDFVHRRELGDHRASLLAVPEQLEECLRQGLGRRCVLQQFGHQELPGQHVGQADEWLTVTQQVRIGTWADKPGQPERSSTVRLWVAREGHAPVLVYDYDRNLRRPEKPFMRYGKIWLVPFFTGKDPTEDHPTGHRWFDELIVSREAIAPAK